MKSFILTLTLLLTLTLTGQAQTAEEFFQRGKSQFSVKNFNEALALFSKAIQLSNKMMKHYLWRGAVKSELKKI